MANIPVYFSVILSYPDSIFQGGYAFGRNENIPYSMFCICFGMGKILLCDYPLSMNGLNYFNGYWLGFAVRNFNFIA